MALPVGTTLGPYVILGRLGAGGMGEVHRARDPRLGRDVAIKILPATLAENPEAQSRLEQETQILAHVSHPNILEVFDVGIEGGIAYAVTELLEGETLGQRLRNGPMTWRDATEVAGAVANGLAAAHAQKVIHRDLKPDNIFLTRDGRVKILDFGLAERRRSGAWLAEQATPPPGSPSSVAGTLAYMSPEQVRGDRPGPRSDLFSLGATLFEMLTGRRVFGGKSAGDIVAAILHTTPDLSELCETVPEELIRLLERCLCKDPDKRAASAESVAAVLTSLDTATRIRPVQEVAGRTWPRWSTVAATAGGLVLAVFVILTMVSGPRVRSLAVAPVINETGDPGLTFVADRLTESLVERLSTLDGVRVASRLAARTAWATHGEPRAVGLALEVEAVVIAVLSREPDGVAVSLEVVDVRDGSRMAGSRLTDNLGDIYALEGRLAELVAGTLGGTLQPPVPDLSAARRTDIPAAYEAYVRGRFLWSRRTDEGLREALAQFEESIRLDPGFSLPHVGLADTYAVMVNYGLLAPRDGWPLARLAVRRALDLDPDLPGAHAMMGVIASNFDWQWDEAERSLVRALELDPGNLTARRLYSQYLAAVGRFGEALEAIRVAREQEPTLPLLLLAECSNRTIAGDPVGGEAACRQALELAPGFPPAHLFLGLALRRQGRLAEAVDVLEVAVRPGSRDIWTLAEYGHTLALVGDTEGARRVLRTLGEAAEQRYVSPFLEAVVLAGMGERDGAFAALDRALVERCPNLVTIGVSSAMDPLRDDPRFGLLLRRVNLPARLARN